MSRNVLADELRAAAQRLRQTPACTAPGPDCECKTAETLAETLDAEALRGEQLGLVDAFLLDTARRLNAAPGGAL